MPTLLRTTAAPVVPVHKPEKAEAPPDVRQVRRPKVTSRFSVAPVVAPIHKLKSSAALAPVAPVTAPVQRAPAKSPDPLPPAITTRTALMRAARAARPAAAPDPLPPAISVQAPARKIFAREEREMVPFISQTPPREQMAREEQYATERMQKVPATPFVSKKQAAAAKAERETMLEKPPEVSPGEKVPIVEVEKADPVPADVTPIKQPVYVPAATMTPREVAMDAARQAAARGEGLLQQPEAPVQRRGFQLMHLLPFALGGLGGYLGHRYAKKRKVAGAAVGAVAGLALPTIVLYLLMTIGHRQ